VAGSTFTLRAVRRPSRGWPAIVLIVAALMAAALAGCGGGGDDESATTTTGTKATETTTTSASVSETRRKLEDLVRELLTKRGLDPAIIDCALGRLQETTSDEEIKAAAVSIKKTGSPTPEVIDAATEAGQQCAGG
jgi:Flp pilus assembly protein TadD